MTDAQKESLLLEWSTYDTKFQEVIIKRYIKKYNTIPKGDTWFQYLKKILRIEAYWKAVGLA